jgi:hypothetical protein
LNREAFEFVYIHANCLAELALDQLARELELSMAADPPDLPLVTEAEREEQVLALLGRMEMSPVADAWQGGAEFEAQVLSGIEELMEADSAPAANLAGSTPAAFSELAEGSNDSHEGALSLDLYLQRAYAARGRIAARVDDGIARLDLAALERLLNPLPAGLAPLTHALSADELAQWLACYLAGNAALDQIVTLIRGVDTSS